MTSISTDTNVTPSPAASVLIVGASGLVGRRAAEVLRRLHPTLPITVAGRDLAKAQAAAREIGGPTDASTVDLARDDLGLPPQRRHAAVVLFTKDETLAALRHAQRHGIPYAGISSNSFEIAPEVAQAIQSPHAAPVLMLSSWLAGAASVSTLQFARAFASVDTVEIGVVLDEQDMGGPSAWADYERIMAAAPNQLVKQGGQWRWATGDLAARSFTGVDGRKHDARAYAPLDVPSLAALLGAREARLDLVVGESASRRQGLPYSTEIVIELSGRGPGGAPLRTRHEIVHPQGQAPLTALFVALGIERALGLGGVPAPGPGLHLAEQLVDPVRAIEQLRAMGATVREVPLPVTAAVMGEDARRTGALATRPAGTVQRRDPAPFPLLVLGGTGTVGQRVVRQLRQWHPTLPIAIGARDLARARAFAAEVGHASAVRVDLEAADLGLPAQARYAAVAAFLKDGGLQSLRFAQAQGIPYLSFSEFVFDIAPTVAQSLLGAPIPVLLLGQLYGGTAALATLRFAQRYAQVRSISIGAVVDADDLGGPMAQGDFERLAVAPAPLLRRGGRYLWPRDAATLQREVIDHRGVAHTASALPLLDVASLGAALGAADIRVDVAARPADRRGASSELVIELSGVRPGGREVARSRHVLVDDDIASGLSAKGAALALERLLGLDGGPPPAPGLYQPESLLDPARALERLQATGTRVLEFSDAG